MKLDKKLKILIVGLGLIGGSYAMGFSKHGFDVEAIDIDEKSISFAKENKMIKDGYTQVKQEVVGKADIVVFALYPHIFLEWIKKYQIFFKPGAVITDVTGVKSCIVYEIQKILRSDVEFIAAHPMAGREVCKVENSSDEIFKDANYIIVPTDKNSVNAIEVCKAIDRKSVV